jgi:PAS domain S-box-containing protein
VKVISYKRKITYLAIAISLFTLVVGFVVLQQYLRKMLQKTLTDEALAVATLTDEALAVSEKVGNLSIPALQSGNREAVKPTLNSFAEIPQLQSIQVFDAEGKPFASYLKDSTSHLTSTLPDSRIQFTNDILQITGYIMSRNQVVGTVSVRFSSAEIGLKTRGILIWVFVVLLTLAAVWISAMFRIQKETLRRLYLLAEATRNIPESAAYNAPLKDEGNDEIALVFSGFNKMLGKIERREAQRDQAIQSLRESEDRYRTLVESSPEGIILERDGQIVYGNPASRRILERESEEELTNLNLESILHLSEMRSGPESGPAIETTISNRSGKNIDLEVTETKTTYAGRDAIQYLIRDVTESKNLRRAAEKMQRLAALGEFSAMLAHEIRNSIGSISLNVRTLMERLQIPDNYRNNLTNIERGVQRLQHIVKSILDFAKPAPPKLQKVRLDNLLESSLHLVLHEIEASHIQILRNYSSSELYIHVDPDQISQVFVNLLLNAKQAIDRNGTISIATYSLNGSVKVLFTDNGKGIAPEHLNRIFDPFFTTNPGGVGLGLAFATRILDQHKSHIAVDSSVGKGTTFTLTFPSQEN